MKIKTEISLDCADVLSRSRGLMYADFFSRPAVYRIVQKSTGRFYVGSTANMKNRVSRHFRDLELDQHHSVFLQRAWKKYGAIDFRVEVIEYITDRAWVLFHEQAYIDTFNGTQKLFNTCFSAVNCSGVKQTQETIEKRVSQFRGKKRPSWVGEAISIAKKGIRTKAMADAHASAVEKITFRMSDEQLKLVTDLRSSGSSWDVISKAVGISIKPIKKEVSRLLGPEFINHHTTLVRSIGHKRK